MINFKQAELHSPTSSGSSERPGQDLIRDFCWGFEFRLEGLGFRVQGLGFAWDDDNPESGIGLSRRPDTCLSGLVGCADGRRAERALAVEVRWGGLMYAIGPFQGGLCYQLPVPKRAYHLESVSPLPLAVIPSCNFFAAIYEA